MTTGLTCNLSTSGYCPHCASGEPGSGRGTAGARGPGQAAPGRGHVRQLLGPCSGRCPRGGRRVLTRLRLRASAAESHPATSPCGPTRRDFPKPCRRGGRRRPAGLWGALGRERPPCSLGGDDARAHPGAAFPAEGQGYPAGRVTSLCPCVWATSPASVPPVGGAAVTGLCSSGEGGPSPASVPPRGPCRWPLSLHLGHYHQPLSFQSWGHHQPLSLPAGCITGLCPSAWASIPPCGPCHWPLSLCLGCITGLCPSGVGVHNQPLSLHLGHYHQPLSPLSFRSWGASPAIHPFLWAMSPACVLPGGWPVTDLCPSI